MSVVHFTIDRRGGQDALVLLWRDGRVFDSFKTPSYGATKQARQALRRHGYLI